MRYIPYATTCDAWRVVHRISSSAVVASFEECGGDGKSAILFFQATRSSATFFRVRSDGDDVGLGRGVGLLLL